MEPINESDEVIAMDTYDDDQTLYNQYIELDEKYPNIMRPYRKYYDDAMKRNNNVCIFVVINGKTHTVMISDDTTVNEFYAIMNNKLYAMDITHNPNIQVSYDDQEYPRFRITSWVIACRRLWYRQTCNRTNKSIRQHEN